MKYDDVSVRFVLPAAAQAELAELSAALAVRSEGRFERCAAVRHARWAGGERVLGGSSAAQAALQSVRSLPSPAARYGPIVVPTCGGSASDVAIALESAAASRYALEVAAAAGSVDGGTELYVVIGKYVGDPGEAALAFEAFANETFTPSGGDNALAIESIQSVFRRGPKPNPPPVLFGDVITPPSRPPRRWPAAGPPAGVVPCCLDEAARPLLLLGRERRGWGVFRGNARVNSADLADADADVLQTAVRCCCELTMGSLGDEAALRALLAGDANRIECWEGVFAGFLGKLSAGRCETIVKTWQSRRAKVDKEANPITEVAWVSANEVLSRSARARQRGGPGNRETVRLSGRGGALRPYFAARFGSDSARNARWASFCNTGLFLGATGLEPADFGWSEPLEWEPAAHASTPFSPGDNKTTQRRAFTGTGRHRSTLDVPPASGASAGRRFRGRVAPHSASGSPYEFAITVNLDHARSSAAGEGHLPPRPAAVPPARVSSSVLQCEGGLRPDPGQRVSFALLLGRAEDVRLE